jgi:hypothetical protein
MNLREAQSVLIKAGVQIDAGLTAQEFARVESEFEFRFPPDYREFLATGLPVSRGWVNWRSGERSAIHQRFSWPLEGICFDVEQNDFWLGEWGVKPAKLADVLEIVRRAVAEAPVLIPICGHRYIPAIPTDAGNPVFSVHQTDIIYYGADLLEYLQNEFSYYFGRINAPLLITREPRRIGFWTRMVEANC